MSNVSERIKLLREERGWSQRELARRLGVSFPVLNRIEQGKRAVDDVELQKLADIFNVSVDFLLGRTDSVFSKEEEKFLGELHLPIEELLDRFSLVVDGKPATREEIEHAIAFIRAMRSMKGK